MLLFSIIEEHQNFDETIKCSGWIQTRKVQLDSIQKNKTWKFVDLPKGKRPISAKWVFKVKPNLDGKPKKLKACIVANGYEQCESIDFEEKFTLVVKWSMV